MVKGFRSQKQEENARNICQAVSFLSDMGMHTGNCDTLGKGMTQMRFIALVLDQLSNQCLIDLTK
eukprot:c40107_g1_i1 orf=3-194(-)